MDKSEENRKWLNLTTSSQFDTGVGNGHSLENAEHILPGKEKLQLTNLSIFIEALVEQFSRILQKNPKEQQKTYRAICSKLKELSLVNESYRLEELASLRSHYCSAILTTQANCNVPLLRAPIIETSRYATEFEEISWIESGGFGHVYRARNKLDQQEYAIKKIKVKYKDATPFLRTLAEVKTLARLNHINIVQYKSAWFEIAAVTPEVPSLKGQESADLSDDIVFERNTTSADWSATTSDDISPQALCKFQAPSQPLTQPGAELYVCMELCNETLRNWLDRRNEEGGGIDVGIALSIAQQAAAGISHIHNARITHHDIKPSNIFITSNMRVMVGDFGLACTPESETCAVAKGKLGTALYAAPEQLVGQCHQKNDIFSLGLVMLELLHIFSTAMERVHVLKKARANQIPLNIPTKLRDFLSDLTSPWIEKRPTAHDVLHKLTKFGEEFSGSCVGGDEDKDLIIKQLKQQLAEKDDEIKQLHKSLDLIKINPDWP